MTAVIGIDGGQSTIRARVAGSDVVVTAPGSTRFAGSTTARMLDVLTRLGERTPLTGAVIVAGITDVPADHDETATIATEVLQTTGAAEVSVTEDVVTAHAGAFAGSAGVVLIAGTGAVAYGARPAEGRSQRVDGAGFLIGDEGGGFWIGRHALRAVLSAHERRGPATALHAAAADRFGTVDGTLAARIHAMDHPVDAIAQFAIDVIAIAAADQVAAAILDAAAYRLASTALAAASALDGGLEIAFTGRLLTESATLRARLADVVAATAPDTSVALASGNPLDGACFVAEEGHRSPYRSQLVTVGSRP